MLRCDNVTGFSFTNEISISHYALFIANCSTTSILSRCPTLKHFYLPVNSSTALFIKCLAVGVVMGVASMRYNISYKYLVTVSGQPESPFSVVDRILSHQSF